MTRLMNSRREYRDASPVLLSDMPPLPALLGAASIALCAGSDSGSGRRAVIRAAARSRHPGRRDVRTARAHGQVDVEGGAGTRRTLYVDLAVMALHDLPHDRQAEARAFAITPEARARFEDATRHRRLHPDAVVAHG